MRSVARALLAVSLFLSANGCGSVLTVHVNANENLDHPWRAQHTYAIFPYEHQKNDLAFQEYARMVHYKLGEVGIKQGDEKKADLAVFIDYGIGSGKTPHGSSTVPADGPITPFLLIEVVDRAASRKSQRVIHTWQGEVVSDEDPKGPPPRHAVSH